MDNLVVRTGEVLLTFKQEAESSQIESTGIDNVFFFGTTGGMLVLGAGFVILNKAVKREALEKNNHNQLNSSETDIN